MPSLRTTVRSHTRSARVVPVIIADTAVTGGAPESEAAIPRSRTAIETLPDSISTTHAVIFAYSFLTSLAIDVSLYFGPDATLIYHAGGVPYTTTAIKLRSNFGDMA